MFPTSYRGKEYYSTIEILPKPLQEYNDRIYYCDNSTQTELFASDIPTLIRGYILFVDPSASIISHSIAKDKNRRQIKLNNIQIYHSSTQTPITTDPDIKHSRKYINYQRQIPITVIYCPIRLLMYKTTVDQTYLFLPIICHIGYILLAIQNHKCPNT